MMFSWGCRTALTRPESEEPCVPVAKSQSQWSLSLCLSSMRIEFEARITFKLPSKSCHSKKLSSKASCPYLTFSASIYTHTSITFTSKFTRARILTFSFNWSHLIPAHILHTRLQKELQNTLSMNHDFIFDNVIPCPWQWVLTDSKDGTFISLFALNFESFWHRKSPTSRRYMELTSFDQ